MNGLPKHGLLTLVVLMSLSGELEAGGRFPRNCPWENLSGESPKEMRTRLFADPAAAVSALRRKAHELELPYPSRLMNPETDKASESALTGSNNGGLWEATWRDRPVALKVIPLGAYRHHTATAFDGRRLGHPAFSEPVLIQSVLGAFGMAPRIWGVLSRTEMSHLAHRLELTHGMELNLAGGPAVGLVMEKLNSPWNLPKAQRPAWLATWSGELLERAVARIREMESTLNELGIHAQDAQLFVLPNGQVLLGDLDMYRLRRPGDPATDLSPLRERLRREWLRATSRN